MQPALCCLLVTVVRQMKNKAHIALETETHLPARYSKIENIGQSTCNGCPSLISAAPAIPYSPLLLSFLVSTTISSSPFHCILFTKNRTASCASVPKTVICTLSKPTMHNSVAMPHSFLVGYWCYHLLPPMGDCWLHHP